MMDAIVASDTPMLVMTSPTNARYPLVENLVIGRDPNSGLVIPDRRVSRQHAQIVQRKEGFVLLDNDSKNGTFVNGERIAGEYHLQDGDEIEIALCCQLVFVGPGATAPLSAVEPHGQAQRANPMSIVLDVKARRTWIGGLEIQPPLSLAQFRLLRLLWSEPDRVFTREEVACEVWPGEAAGGISEQAIDAVARRLRERLADVGANKMIVTVRGHGFRLLVPEQ